MKPTSVAVVGTGFIGPVHVEALQRSGNRVVGILGSSLEKSQAAATSLGLPKAYAGYDEVLADAAVQAVHLTTPNKLHYEQCCQAIDAGKHVLCEKPLSMTSTESADLVSRATAADVVCGVNYNIRYYPLCIEARERIRNGSLGDVYHITGGYVQDWLLYDTDYNWRVDAEDGGALRAVADIGTHWLDLLQHIVGSRVTSVCADLTIVHAQRQRPIGGALTFSGGSERTRETEPVDVQTEDHGHTLLQFDNGVRGSMNVSQVAAGRKNCLRFEIAASKQAIAWNSESPNELWVGHRDRANEQLIRDPALMSDAAAQACSYPGGHAEGFSDTFKQLFRDFYGYIAEGDMSATPGFPTFTDGHREILLCEAILKSHQQRRWVDVASADGQ